MWPLPRKAGWRCRSSSCHHLSPAWFNPTWWRGCQWSVRRRERALRRTRARTRVVSLGNVHSPPSVSLCCSEGILVRFRPSTTAAAADCWDKRTEQCYPGSIATSPATDGRGEGEPRDETTFFGASGSLHGRALRRAGSWPSGSIATWSAGGPIPVLTGGLSTFMSPHSSSFPILSIILSPSDELTTALPTHACSRVLLSRVVSGGICACQGHRQPPA
jgi:hypothetical protein